MSSAPGGGDIAFVIKEAGDFTRSLGQVRPGTTAYVDGPHGNLTLDRRHGKGIALLAGGVGIAPLISMLRELARSGDPRPIVLVYGNRAADQIVYRDELDALAKRENVSVVHVLSEPPPGWTGLVGQLDAERIRAQFAFPDAREWIYFVCGPPAMLEACERALIALGVPPAQIVSERFRYD
jgi:NAD(P)H-flavin reductase